MATFRGVDGSVTVDANTVLEVLGWEADIDRDMFENSELGEEGKTYSPQQYDLTARINANFDYGDATGQKLLFDRLIETNPAALALELLHATGKKLVFSGHPSNASIRKEKGSDDQVTFTVRPSGPLTIAWA